MHDLIANEPTVKTLAVIGLGYIGLPTATMFASRGIEVLGVDIEDRVVNAVNSGQPHIEEGGLDELLAACVKQGLLRAAKTPEPADAFIIAVPTPFLHVGSGHDPDVSYVEAAGRSIAPHLAPGNVVILESTSPVGTTEMLSMLLAELRPDLSFPHQVGDESDIRISYCPERIIPGMMLRELVENDRIIGGMSERCAGEASKLYGTFVKGARLETSARTAELVKLTENAYRDVNIAFANELSMICDRLDLNPWEVIRLANRHPRVSILAPGPGVGGHCIAVDPWFIVASNPDEARLIRTAREVNDQKPQFVIEKVESAKAHNPSARIACLGLTYKPNVDDFRESPSLQIAAQLTAKYPGEVVCVDPFRGSMPPKLQEQAGLTFVDKDSVGCAQIVVMLVGHDAFADVRPDESVVTIDAVGYWS